MSSNSVVPLRRCCDFSNFQNGCCRHVAFLKSRNFIGYWLQRRRRISVPNFIKIGQSVAKILRFFDFFKMAAVRHLGFVWGIFGPLPTVSTWGLYHSAKFGYDQCSSFYNVNISIFDTFGWKIPIHTPKNGVLGQFDTQNVVQYQQKPKRHILA